MTIVAELGDLMRFARPSHLLGYCGMSQLNTSSGSERHRGHIT
jgi:transposase